MSTVSRILLVATLGLVALTAQGADEPTKAIVDRDGLASIREATRELTREVEYLQEDIITELRGVKERTLYRQADAVLVSIEAFQKSLKPGISHEQLFKEFDKVDDQLHELLKGVQATGPEQRLLQRSAVRVGAADEQLHYEVSAKDVSESNARQALERHTRGLVTAVRQLDKTGQYALGAVQGQAVLLANLHAVAEAVDRYERSQAAGAGREQLRRDFAAVTQAWEQAGRGLQQLPPADNMHLLRIADRADRYHERLFRLLGMEGTRPRLILRA